MAKMLGLDLGTNSIGWAITDTGTSEIVNRGIKILPALTRKRSLQRAARRKARQRTLTKKMLTQVFPVFIHMLLAVLLTAFLLMALIYQKDFQFWFNLSITVLLAWIATKK